MHDLRLALRRLLKEPGFTAVAVLTLALGIGENTVVFSVAKTVLFRPLGLEDASRLMWLQWANTRTGTPEDRLSWRDMDDVREGTQSFESVATFGMGSEPWEHNGQVERRSILQATAELPALLRLRPALGRTFLPGESDATAQPVVMISHELWQERFGGSADVLGKVIRLDGRSRDIVGVLPAGLEFPLERTPAVGTSSDSAPRVRSFWVPMTPPTGPDLTSRANRMFLTVVRLKPAATEESARAELRVLGERLATDHPETNRQRHFELVSFRDQLLGQTRRGLPLLALAVGAVLLISCVNLANLLLARGAARQRELAVRTALGAGRSRLVRALLMESAAIAALGGGLGLVLAHGTLHAVHRLAGASVPFIREASLDGTALAFTVGLSLATSLLFGLLPALRLSRVDPADSLRGGTRITGGPQLRAWQHGLVTAQITMVIVLLFSASLLLESFRRLMGQDLGYQPRGVLLIDVEGWGFDTNGDMCRMYRSLRARLAAVPGVEAVGTVSSAPLTGKWPFDEKAQVFGESVPETDRPALAATFVAFDYFKAMDIPLLEGRVFRDSELDDDGYGKIVVLNESAAKQLFPGRSAVGGRFTVGSNPDRVLEVIGVVKDTRDVRLEARPQPRFYWQYAFGGAQVAIRLAAPATAVLPSIREIVRTADPRVSAQDVREMSAVVAGTVAERRFLMTLLTAYALVALGIAIVGVFGAIAYQVSQRTNEFGIRLALGASPAGVIRLVLHQALRLAAVGVAAGMAISLAAGRLISSHLFDLSPHNPLLLGLASLVVLGAALLSGIIPARRAARVDPMVALRHE